VSASFSKGKGGMTALHMAAKVGHEKSCMAILAASSNPKSLLDISDDGGYPPMVWCAENGFLGLIRLVSNQKKRCNPSECHNKPFFGYDHKVK
jgi:ankyrin repeat protein